MIVLFGVGFWLFVRILPVVLVLVAALFIAGTLTPVIAWFESRGVGRNRAIVIVFSVLTITSGGFVALTIPSLLNQAKSLFAQEPVIRARIVGFLEHSTIASPLAQSLRDLKYGDLPGVTGSNAISISGQVIEFVGYTLAAIFLALYILIDRDRLRGWLFAVMPRRHHIRLSRIMLNLESIVGGYIRGQLITSAAIGVFMFVLLTLFGVPDALALAAFGGVADVLPYVGALLTIVPAAIAAFAKGPVIMVTIVVLMLIYEEFESRVLVPLVYGRALRMPSAIVMLSLLVGATLMGIIGALLALPVAAGLLMLIDELRVELPGESIQADVEATRKKDDRAEELYEALTEGMSAEEAAGVAVEISRDE